MAVGDEQLMVEESQGCLPCLQKQLISIRGCSEEDHGQPRRVGGNCRASERPVCRGEFGLEGANWGNLKSVSMRNYEVQKEFQRTKNDRHSSILRQKINEALWNFVEVSIISVPEKILEQIVTWSIYKHLDNNMATRKSLKGFVKNKPCQTCLISPLDRRAG